MATTCKHSGIRKTKFEYIFEREKNLKIFRLFLEYYYLLETA